MSDNILASIMLICFCIALVVWGIAIVINTIATICRKTIISIYANNARSCACRYLVCCSIPKDKNIEKLANRIQLKERLYAAVPFYIYNMYTKHLFSTFRIKANGDFGDGRLGCNHAIHLSIEDTDEYIVLHTLKDIDDPIIYKYDHTCTI